MQSNEYLNVYLKEIAAYPLLNKEEEENLSARIELGDMEARDLLIRSNLRLVVSIARKYQGHGRSLVDLIENGNIGLIRAATGYRYAYGTRFATYAVYWIKQNIGRGLKNEERLIRVPAYMFGLMGKYNKAKDELATQGVLEPTEDEIAEKAKITKKQLKILKKTQRLNPITTDKAGAETVLNSLAATDKARPYSPEEIETTLQFVDRLSPREGEVIRMRFGIDCNPLTLKEIGNVIGLTKERVRQIQNDAIERLAHWLEKNPTS